MNTTRIIREVKRESSEFNFQLAHRTKVVSYYLFIFLICMAASSCRKEKEKEVEREKTSGLFWIRNQDSEMPVILSGNMESDKILLIIHGGPGGSSAQYLRGFEENLGEDFLLASWDQRYSGFSKFNSNRPLSMTIESNIEDCDLIVDFLNEKFPGKEVVLWGQSFGGAIVSGYASHPTYNNKIAGWIVVNGAVSGFELHRSIWEFAVRRCNDKIQEGFVNYQDSLNWLENNPYDPMVFNENQLWKVLLMAGSLYFEGEIELTEADFNYALQRAKDFFPLESDVDRYINNANLPVNNEFPYSPEMYNWRVNVSPISKPGLLIWGEKDETCPLELVQWYSNELTSAQKLHTVKLYANAWHVPFDSDQEEHDADVQQFIESLP